MKKTVQKFMHYATITTPHGKFKRQKTWGKIITVEGRKKYLLYDLETNKLKEVDEKEFQKGTNLDYQISIGNIIVSDIVTWVIEEKKRKL